MESTKPYLPSINRYQLKKATEYQDSTEPDNINKVPLTAKPQPGQFIKHPKGINRINHHIINYQHIIEQLTAIAIRS